MWDPTKVHLVDSYLMLTIQFLAQWKSCLKYSCCNSIKFNVTARMRSIKLRLSWKRMRMISVDVLFCGLYSHSKGLKVSSLLCQLQTSSHIIKTGMKHFAICFSKLAKYIFFLFWIFYYFCFFVCVATTFFYFFIFLELQFECHEALF